jgi:hypothetical protein
MTTGRSTVGILRPLGAALWGTAGAPARARRLPGDDAATHSLASADGRACGFPQPPGLARARLDGVAGAAPAGRGRLLRCEPARAQPALDGHLLEGKGRSCRSVRCVREQVPQAQAATAGALRGAARARERRTLMSGIGGRLRPHTHGDGTAALRSRPAARDGDIALSHDRRGGHLPAFRDSSRHPHVGVARPPAASWATGQREPVQARGPGPLRRDLRRLWGA